VRSSSLLSGNTSWLKHVKPAPTDNDNHFILRGFSGLFLMAQKWARHMQHRSYSPEAKFQFTLNQYTTTFPTKERHPAVAVQA